jgi:hypothetical protein
MPHRLPAAASRWRSGTRIRHGHLGIQHRDPDIGANLRLAAQREDHVEFVRDVVAEEPPRREVAAQPFRLSAEPTEIAQQISRRPGRRQRRGHGRVRAVERAAVAKHRARHRSQRRTEPDDKVSQHLVVGPALTQAGPRPVGGGEATGELQESLVVVSQQITHGHRGAPAGRRFGPRVPVRPAADGRSQSGRSRNAAPHRRAPCGRPARRIRGR